MTPERRPLLDSLRIEDHQRGSVPSDRLAGRRAWWAGATAATALLSAAVWWQLPRPVDVITAAASPREAGTARTAAVLQASGHVIARRRATVSSEVTGRLTAVLIEEGEKVRQGQVIARLDAGQLEAALAVTRAQADAAHAQARHARAELVQHQADLARQLQLADAGLVPPQATERARTAVATAAAIVESRERAAAAAQAQAEQARIALAQAEVRAPFAGVVIDKSAQVGEIVSPLSAGGGFTRTGIGTIVDMESLEVAVDVNEASIGSVQPGMRAETVLDAYPQWRIPSRVIAVVPAADRGKATIRVRVALEQRDDRVVPDMAVRVSFSSDPVRVEPGTSPSRDVLVPKGAIVEQAGGQAVWVVADGKAVLRPVNARSRSGEGVVVDGLQPGERVVVAPPGTLREGSTVRDTAPAAPR